MRVLITNDDGIRGEGLRILAEFAQKQAEIVIAAPKSEKSACSQGIVLKRPFSCVKSDLFKDLGIEAYEVDSTPADCVRIAVDLFGPFDLVLSGINNGLNTGHFINYSGTCAAAFEAAAIGIPAVALSTYAGRLPEVVPDLPRILAYFKEHRLMKKHSLYNVNIAPGFRDFMITRTEPAFCHDNFIQAGENEYLATLDLSEWEHKEPDLRYDMEALFAGYCSVTPLTTERTDVGVYEKLKG